MTSTRRTRRWLGGAWQVTAAPLVLLIALPLLAVFLRLSPSDLWESLKSPQVWQAIRLSWTTSLATVAVTLIAGTPVAWLVYRRRSLLQRVVDALIELPMVLPPAVAGVALLMAFGRQGLLGAGLHTLGIQIPFTTAAVVIAQTFVAAPLYIRSAAVGFAGVDAELHEAAALDGASRWQAFSQVVVPMSWMAIVSGSVLTWARALGEFGATMIFAGNLSGRTQTMPLAIYMGFEINLSVALTLSAIMILFSMIVVALFKGALRNRLEAGAERALER